MIKVSKLQKYLHELMYKDEATIYRSVKIEDEETGESDYALKKVYETIPCKLSQYGKGISQHTEDRAGVVTLDLRLTCDPFYEIEEGDIIEVNHEGGAYRLIAGTSFNYPTHKEISVRRRRENEQR